VRPAESPNDWLSCAAMIARWVGDKDLACQQLTIAVRSWRRANYGQLKLLLFRDPLRGGPRFEAIIASLGRRRQQNR